MSLIKPTRQQLGLSTTPANNFILDASDLAAATAGVPIGWLYHTSGAVKVRLT